MVWVAPKTWNELDTLTSQDMNEQVSGNIQYLKNLANTRMNVQTITYTSAISVALTGAWADIVAATPTALQVNITPRDTSSLFLCSYRGGHGISAAGDLYFSVRINGSGNTAMVVTTGFNSSFVSWDAYITLPAGSNSIKPMWQCPPGRTLTHASGSTLRFTVLELGPLE